VLARMGVEMDGGDGMAVQEIREPGPEPVATLEVRHARLTAATVTREEVPSLIDELPLVALLGCFAEGETVVSGAEELRHKESDRIATVVDGLAALGAEIEARPDGFAVRGTGGLRGGSLDARGDHRLAMLGAIAGLASRDGVELAGFDSVAVSYPSFEADLRSVLA
jgi:3-phosphoshikimate 1-carboxyvinyltransferase